MLGWAEKAGMFDLFQGKFLFMNNLLQRQGNYSVKINVRSL